MLKKFTSIVVAGAHAVGVAAPAPALAQDTPQQSSGEQFGQSARARSELIGGQEQVQVIQGLIAMSALAPFMLSSEALSGLEFE